MRKSPLVLMLTAIYASHIYAQDIVQTDESNTASLHKLEVITITASADASAEGLMDEFSGGQVASGARVGIFGNQTNLDSSFNTISYTNQYIEEHQSKSVGDILQADPSVRVARGFGNFQETYFIRGFLTISDDTAYNGLYSILPRQYIPAELFERVEILKGASGFLNGSTPGNGGIGGAINLLPKRAGKEPLNRVTLSTNFNGAGVASDLSNRFGEEQRFGVRLNTAYHNSGTNVDDEKSSLGLAAIGLDYQGDHFRLSGDMGYTNNKLDRTRPSVTLQNSVTSTPLVPSNTKNYAQDWAYSNEEAVFGSYRAEYDFNDDITAYTAYGFRHSKEKNNLANLRLLDAITGDGTVYRFGNSREDDINTGEIGIRFALQTGSIGHKFVLNSSIFESKEKNSLLMDFGNLLPNNLYNGIKHSEPTWSNGVFAGNSFDNPKLRGRVQLQSVAFGDQISALDDRMLITLGGRYQQIKQTNYAWDTAQVEGKIYDESKVTPAFGINYKLTPELSIYGNYIEALVKGATVNNQNALNHGSLLSPFVSEQKEIGLKYENGAIGGVLNYFNTNRARAYLNSANYVTDEGENLHQGIEFQLYGQLTDDVKILGGGTWLDAKQKKTDNGVYDDKRVIGVPKFQANIEADWKLPIAQNISVNGRVIYTGSSYANNANTLKVPDWTSVDIGSSYSTQFGQIPTKFNFRINNLFDKDYWASVGGYEDAGYLTVSQPRTFLLSAVFDF